jgi:hypothetical protein
MRRRCPLMTQSGRGRIFTLAPFESGFRHFQKVPRPDTMLLL